MHSLPQASSRTPHQTSTSAQIPTPFAKTLPPPSKAHPMNSPKLESLIILETLYQENLLQNKRPTTQCKSCFFSPLKLFICNGLF
jgi:hypothetical protein